MTESPAPVDSPSATPSPSPSPSGTFSEAPIDVSGAEAATGGEWLEFWASVLGSLAWPILVVVVLLLFHRQVLKLVTALLNRVPEMESLNTPWGEAVWSKSAVDKVSKEVDAKIPGRPSKRKPKPSDVDNDLDNDVSVQLARIQPSAGVINAFLQVEQEVRRYLELLDLQWRGSPIVTFRRAPAVPVRLKRLVDELAKLRNAAAHGQGDITEESALDYITSSKRVADELGTLTDELAAGRMTV